MTVRKLTILLSLIFFVFPVSPALPASAAPSSTVYFVKADGIINPVMAEFIVKGIAFAAKEKAEAVVIELDTPGGLDLSMRDIVKAELGSEVPVAVYVAPSGSRAASAGVFIVYAANIAAMAPGTNTGSAHPVEMGGGKMDETMRKKVENDAVAYIMGIAAKRNRNAAWAERAVRESVNVTAEEALKLKVIDIVAGSREKLIEEMDGRKVELAGGEKTLRTKGARIKNIDMNLRFRVLSAISNPNVAYILMMIGLVGLYFELSNPGLILPGVLGAVCLVLAFYAFQTLSVNYAGLILIFLGLIFFVVELKVASYGLLAIAGIVSLVLGSLMLFDSSLPYMGLSIWVVLPTIVLMTAIILGAMYYAVRIYRKKPASGAEALIGEEASVVEDIGPGKTGKVFMEGEYWNAVSGEEIKKGEKAR
ncbi:MAG: nodulation protein NfeD, partial [Deltaproteobacteria bacterium]